jgi:hypothetical protein
MHDRDRSFPGSRATLRFGSQLQPVCSSAAQASAPHISAGDIRSASVTLFDALEVRRAVLLFLVRRDSVLSHHHDRPHVHRNHAQVHSCSHPWIQKQRRRRTGTQATSSSASYCTGRGSLSLSGTVQSQWAPVVRVAPGPGGRARPGASC